MFGQEELQQEKGQLAEELSQGLHAYILNLKHC